MSEDATGPDPSTQDDLVTLEAELRRALQHQRAEMERAREAQEEVSRLLERARAALDRAREGVHRAPCHPERSEGSAPGGQHPA